MNDPDLNVLCVFGTRPEAVKMAPIIKQLEHTEGVSSAVCVTAQHRQMLDQALNLFSIVPDYDLDVMRSDQSLASLSTAVFNGLQPVFDEVKPDWVLIQGDTTTVMVTALTAYYQRVRVGHVEAGLRTGDKWQPFPEEINRRVASVIADLHFAPTKWAHDNLVDEGVPPESIAVTGNPVIDALLDVAARPYEPKDASLADIPEDHQVILVTAHRRENFGEPMERIFSALRNVAERYSGNVTMIYPVHLNPNVQEPAQRILGDVANIRLTGPMDYQAMVYWMKRARLILTDSGGLQEEAPALGTPVLVMREVTERPEAIEAGTARLVGSDPELIVAETVRLLEDPEAYEAMAKAVNPYGDGHAAERIVSALLRAHRSSAGQSLDPPSGKV
ncbi:MAG: UDP-N-acetylglucosamine 2-epimerase (non-hydrolyzing) [Anaerolineales bacterium]|jgi:UDP-N-acetylglucosamine 2-epimerase (non-hydrolysing)